MLATLFRSSRFNILRVNNTVRRRWKTIWYMFETVVVDQSEKIIARISVYGFTNGTVWETRYLSGIRSRREIARLIFSIKCRTVKMQCDYCAVRTIVERWKRVLGPFIVRAFDCIFGHACIFWTKRFSGSDSPPRLDWSARSKITLSLRALGLGLTRTRRLNHYRQGLREQREAKVLEHGWNIFVRVLLNV